MKASYLDEQGGPEVLKYGDLPDPIAGGGEDVGDHEQDYSLAGSMAALATRAAGSVSYTHLTLPTTPYV